MICLYRLSVFNTLRTRLSLAFMAIVIAGTQTACTTAPGIVATSPTTPGVAASAPATNSEALATPLAPAAPREFRAAWVATVSNIDWPSRADLTSEKQQAEIIAILDRAAELKLNAIILQVRPSADAIYP